MVTYVINGSIRASQEKERASSVIAGNWDYILDLGKETFMDKLREPTSTHHCRVLWLLFSSST